MSSYLFDILILALLAFFCWRGAARGLILSLCGLVAVFVAFFCAQFVSDQFFQPVSNLIQPTITQALQVAEPSSDESGQQSDYSMDQLLTGLEDANLFVGFIHFLKSGSAHDAIQEEAHLSLLDALAGYLSKGVAKALLFALSFLLVQFLWVFASHAFDLAFHLPILSTFNTVGGMAVGLVKATLLIVVLVWLGQLAGWVPNPPHTPVLSLFTVQRLEELLNDFPG